MVQLGSLGLLRKHDSGSRARLPEGTRIYAIGDIHGCVNLLDQTLERIDAHLASNIASRVIEVYLGDYIDRGPNSRQVINRLISRGRDRTTICLKGNHEHYASEFLINPAVFDEWKQYGGCATLNSYDLSPPENPEPNEKEELSRLFNSKLPRSHHHFFKTLQPSFTCGDYYFVHAGVRPGVPLADQALKDLLWIRQEFLFHKGDFGKVVVHGHTPVREPDVQPNRINIDTGAYFSGRLDCLVLQEGQISFV